MTHAISAGTSKRKANPHVKSLARFVQIMIPPVCHRIVANLENLPRCQDNHDAAMSSAITACVSQSMLGHPDKDLQYT